MDIFETSDFLKDELKKNQGSSADLMYGYSIETDPYTDLAKLVPLVLIEAERTEFIQSSEYGTPAIQEHSFSVTVFENAQKVVFSTYKRKLVTAVKKVITKLMTINDWRISQIKPSEAVYNEVEIGSLKTTAGVIDVKVRTKWED